MQFQQRAQTRALTHRHSLHSVYGRRQVAHARYGFLAPVAVPSRSSTQSSHSFFLEVGYDEEAMAASWELLRTTGCAFHCQAASSELPFQYSQSLADASALQQLRDICREAWSASTWLCVLDFNLSVCSGAAAQSLPLNPEAEIEIVFTSSDASCSLCSYLSCGLMKLSN